MITILSILVWNLWIKRQLTNRRGTKDIHSSKKIKVRDTITILKPWIPLHQLDEPIEVYYSSVSPFRRPLLEFRLIMTFRKSASYASLLQHQVIATQHAICYKLPNIYADLSPRRAEFLSPHLLWRVLLIEILFYHIYDILPRKPKQWHMSLLDY